MPSPVLSLFFLRWHYPNQVPGSKFTTSSQPVYKLPCFLLFQYKLLFSSCQEKICAYYIIPKDLRIYSQAVTVKALPRVVSITTLDVRVPS